MNKRPRISEDQTSFHSSENEFSQENVNPIPISSLNMTPPPIVRQIAFNHETWTILDNHQYTSLIENQNAQNNLN